MTRNSINNELKVYLNESGFISSKTRDKVLKIFCEVFEVDLDINNYKNVDLSFDEDYKIIYREDKFESNIKNKEELEEKYLIFKERVDKFMSNKEINFESKGKYNNIMNIIALIILVFVFIVIVLFCIRSFFIGDYFNLLWFIFILVPAILPNFKENLRNRFAQAKRYLKSLKKKK